MLRLRLSSLVRIAGRILSGRPRNSWPGPADSMTPNHSTLDRAGPDSQHRVERAYADEAGRKRDYPDQSPQRLRADEHDGEQCKSDDDAQGAIDISFIPGHFIAPVDVTGRDSIAFTAPPTVTLSPCICENLFQRVSVGDENAFVPLLHEALFGKCIEPTRYIGAPGSSLGCQRRVGRTHDSKVICQLE